jgi:hypothetical protein
VSRAIGTLADDAPVLSGQPPPAPPEVQASAAVAIPQAVRRALALHLEGGVETRLGGVLYLINLMQHLHLPACFEADWWLASQVGAWGVLEVLGRSLLAREGEDWSADSLWTALACLDGRLPGVLPGETCSGSDRFCLPVSWEAPEAEQDAVVYYWATRHQRLRLWSAPGYMLEDGPRHATAPEEQAGTALRRYRRAAAPGQLVPAAFEQAPLADLSSPLVVGLNPHLRRWLALVLPYICLRLHRALGSAAAEVCDLHQVLLLRPGRLYVSSSHVDLILRLDDISLPVRLAGLDRDPGWLPDFARVVLFHFE